jgi:hypothetical protein
MRMLALAGHQARSWDENDCSYGRPRSLDARPTMAVCGACANPASSLDAVLATTPAGDPRARLTTATATVRTIRPVLG